MIVELEQDEIEAIKMALETAWADDDAPIYDTDEGCNLAARIAAKFGAEIWEGALPQ